VTAPPETLEAGDVDPAGDTAPRDALVRIGLLTELHRDAAAVWALEGPRVSFTRGETAGAVSEDGTLTVRCVDPWMSSQHARLEREGGGWRVVDDGSRNGVLVGDRRVSQHALRPGEVFVLGRTAWAVYRHPLPPELLAAAERPFGPTRSVCPSFLATVLTLERCAASLLTVVLQGETGTGKEVLAREVHRRSGRGGAFVAVNCAALPDALIEGQLFGHRRGAFTGASEGAMGLVAASSGGTLFLDEISDMPPAAQAKLLRVLEERAVLPLGETAPRKVDLRVIAAGQGDLRAEVEAGRFRRDLFVCLAQVVVTVPPLRERRGDLALLTAHLCAETGSTLTLAAARVLFAYPWPMNVRELHNGLRAAAVLAGGQPIDAAHLPAAWQGEGSAAPPADSADGGPSREELEALLGRHQGNVTAAARELGKGKMQLYRWMSRRGIDPRSFRLPSQR
jgi:hypothetical protein